MEINADKQTKLLGKRLKKEGIFFKEDRLHAKKLWGGDDLNLEIQVSKDSGIYVGFDRWGYCVEGIDLKLEEGLDQASLEDTVMYIKNLIVKS